MNQTSADENEWQLGWRIVLACAVANGTGIALLFYCFSLFLIPMSADLGLTRTETGIVQALIITAVLGAPVIGRMTDLFGFRPVFVACTVILVCNGLLLGFWVSGFWSLALSVALAGFVGGGASSVTLTQPINAHFHHFRGRALGLVGIGVSLTTIIVPPFLQLVIAENWRWGYLALAGLSGLVGLPAVLLLLPRNIGLRGIKRGQPGLPGDWSFLRVRDFWLLSFANMVAGMATGGAVSQLAPMVIEHGLSPAIGALGLSSFAAGQFIGKLGGGWLLDRFDPRQMAVLMTIIPSMGFLVFTQADPGITWLVLVACGMIGALSGADIDIYAYFVARRFGLAHYGSVFGALHGIGWIGTAAGITLFSKIFARTGSYGPAQYLAIGLLLIAATLLAPVSIPRRTGANSKNPLLDDALVAESQASQFP
ncbi:MAG: MFS transporter [Novosphingobium sp.]